MKPNSKRLHMFDIDGTLLTIDTKVWIIDKEEPHKPIIRIDNFEVNKILTGIYMKDELKIQYNGEVYYISNKLMNDINKKKRIPIERLGISWIEFYSEDYINNTKSTFLAKNIRHLRGRGEFISLISGRSNRSRHSDVLNSLRKNLKDLGIELYKIYFLGDKFSYKHTDIISLNKTHILLEHLVGVKIEDGKFVSFRQDWFNDIYFYDDEKMNIDYANDIQRIFDRVMKNTDNEVFKLIIDRVKNNELKITNNLVSNNEVNLFESNTIILKSPFKFPIN